MSIPFTIDADVFSVQFSSDAEQDRRTPVWRAIGLLISNYAKVETALHIYARRLSGIDDAKARIFLAKLQVSDVIGRIKELLSLSGASTVDIAEFEMLSKQLYKITEARHLMVHNGVSFKNETEVFVHKKFVSRTATSYQEGEFSLGQLHAMVDDCGCIAFRLLALSEPASLYGFLADQAETMRAFVLSPWRY